MNELCLHNVQSIVWKSPAKKGSLVTWRDLVITDKQGNKFTIALFSEDESNLNVKE